MEAAFSGESDPVMVNTAPEKKIRSGYVEIHAGFGNVFFSFQWDEPYDHLWRVEQMLGRVLTDTEVDSVTKQIATLFSEMKWSIAEEVVATTFDELLAGIDAVEDRLRELEDSQFKAFEQSLETIARNYQLYRRKNA